MGRPERIEWYAGKSLRCVRCGGYVVTMEEGGQALCHDCGLLVVPTVVVRPYTGRGRAAGIVGLLILGIVGAAALASFAFSRTPIHTLSLLLLLIGLLAVLSGGYIAAAGTPPSRSFGISRLIDLRRAEESIESFGTIELLVGSGASLLLVGWLLYRL